MRQRRLDSCHSEVAAPTTLGTRQPWRVALSLLLMFCIVSYGCGTMQIPDYPKTTAGSLRNATTQQDLCIAVRAITDKKELEQYFGTDLASLRVLPVYVVAENRSLSTSFLLANDKISMEHKETKTSMRQGSDAVTGDLSTAANAATAVAGTVGAVAMLGPVIISPILIPLAMVGSQARSDATVIKQNLVSKALETRTISPGKSVNGFVYFNLPDEKVSLVDWSISLHVKELGSDSVHQFVLALE